MSTKIEYCDETINPIRTREEGWYCVKSSPGCLNCYAEKINKRFGDGHNYAKRDVELVLNEKALEKPLKWKKSKRIFIQDMSDLFLPVNGDYFSRVQHQAHCRIVDLIKKTPQHTYIMLTKYPGEMFLSFMGASGTGNGLLNGESLPNLYLGITAENQQMFDKRWAILKQIPAAVYMISYEPALGPLVLPPDFLALGQRAWVVVGGESGPRARPMHPDWARGVRDQCVEAGVNFFFKQWGEFAPVYPKFDELDVLRSDSYTGKMGLTNICGSQAKELLVGNNGGIFQETNYRKPSNHCLFAEGHREEPYDLEVNDLNRVDLKTVNPWWVAKIGKKAAGRELDGQVYDQMPGRM